jgi:hypothetical protein
MASYCFIVDSASLGASKVPAFNISLLGTAKACIDSFLKIAYTKSKGNISQMLLNCEGDRSCILSYLDDSKALFEKKLKYLETDVYQPSLLYPLELAMITFNKIRNIKKIDNFGQGWVPWIIDPVYVFLFVDGTVPLDGVGTSALFHF